MKGVGLSLVFGAGLAGCAVLTVDVDVYKGAFVNEEHVQLHQLTALATAAKPMLVGLRNDLEWPHDKGMPMEAHQKCSDHDQNWYEHGYVDEPVRSMPEKRWIAPPRHELPSTLSTDKQDVTCWKGFQNPMARRVNRILHLYENLGTEDLSFFAKKLLDAQAQAQAAQSILEGDEKRDSKRSNLINTGFKSTSLLDNNQKLLKGGYETLLRLNSSKKSGSPVREVGVLMDALRGIADSINKTDKGRTEEKTIEQVLTKNWQTSKLYELSVPPYIYDRRLPFRAVWKLLAEVDNDSILAEATKELFKTDTQGTEAHKVLTEWVRELTEAYWDAREVHHELWEAILRVVIQLDRLEQKEPGRQQALLDQAIDAAVRLTSLRHVASALHRVNSPEQCALLSKALTSGMTCDSADATPQAMWTESAVLADPDRHEVFLRRALSKAPSDTANFLLDLDHLEKSAIHPQPQDKVNDLVQAVNAVSARHVVRLGLNRSYIGYIDWEGEQKEHPDNLQPLIQELSRGLAGGFERGRLFYGIHTLTEKYLQAHDRATNTHNSRFTEDRAEEVHERRLLDALVEFAEKIRVLANHEELASPPGTPGLLPGSGENLGRGLLGDRLMDFMYYNTPFLFGTGLPTRIRHQYTRVLQAVGNSILFSANELRERERHREEGQKKVIVEVMAARSVYSPDPAKVLTDLLRELEHEKTTDQKELNAANERKPRLSTQLDALEDKLIIAKRRLDEITQKVDTHKRDFTPVEITHQVLMDQVSTKDRAQWKDEWNKNNKESAPDAFLKDSADGLHGKLKTTRKNQSPAATDKISKLDDAINYVTSQVAADRFTTYRTKNDLKAKKYSDLLDEFIEHIKEEEKARQEQNALNKKEQDAKSDELRRVDENIDALRKEDFHLVQQISELPKRIEQLGIAKMEIQSIQHDVLKEVDALRKPIDSQFVSPAAIYGLIRSQLQKKTPPASQATDDILASRVPPPAMPPLDPKGYKSPIDVMDSVIALLRHRHIEAVERFGKGSAQEEKATEALENAYRHRASMIYIRPSSAYLRTSFPSTSLQDDPNLAWDNMLLKQGLRNLPFSSELRDILDPSVKQDRTLTSELDKQHWQNINRVRVSGAGGTNQALVKDDVGNWYVKQYYGKTEQIWQSAKNLALFSMSAKVPIDLTKQLNKASSPEEYAENSKESPTLQKVLEKHQGAYTTHTKEIQGKLDRLHDKELQETLIAAWDAHRDLKDDATFNAELKQALTVEIGVWKKAAATLKEKADQDPGQAIVKDVGALSRLGRILLVSITKISSSDITREEKELEENQKKLAKEQDKEKLETEKKKLDAKKAELEKKREMAVFEVHKVVGGQVTDILTDRNRALDHYEQAIAFIGDAANPKETK